MSDWLGWGAYLGMALACALQYCNARAWRRIANTWRATAEKWERAAQHGMDTLDQIVAHAEQDEVSE